MLARGDTVLKSIWPREGAEDVPLPLTLAVVGLAGAIYGGFMGSFGLGSAERLLMVIYAAVKVPLLIVATTAVCLPAFFVLNTVAGLREDFGRAMRAIVASQGAMTAGLASLGPITALVYVSGATHRGALLTNAVMFGVSTLSAQGVLLARYRGLVAERPGHRIMLWVWVGLYIFVGIQMGWMLRPFVGSPEKAVTFLRSEPFSNAYVVVWKLIRG